MTPIRLIQGPDLCHLLRYEDCQDLATDVAPVTEQMERDVDAQPCEAEAAVLSIGSTYELDPTLRSSLASPFALLERAHPGSEATLSGSLREGSADAYSDIDVCWEVPDELFLSCVDGLRENLSEVRASYLCGRRPNSRISKAPRRLRTVRWSPSVWRLDWRSRAVSPRDSGYDLDNELARGKTGRLLTAPD